MRDDSITRGYKGLTNKERAILALHHLCEENELEYQRIESATPWKRYDCLDFEYRNWLDGIFHMASFWAIEHWKLRTQQAATWGLYFSLNQRSKNKEIDNISEKAILIESCLLALDKALEKVCEVHRLDISMIRRVADTEKFASVFPGLPSNIEYMEEMSSYLLKCLPLGRIENSS
ncbi:hypothetical protein K1X76_08675 [bacterium]|nr:hypothetical protein [bacterium]